MWKKSVLIGVLLTLCTLHAVTPFSISGLKQLSVHVADYSDLLDSSMKARLERVMHQKLKALGIDTQGYFNESFILLLKSQKVGKITLLHLDLMVSGDVVRMTQKTPTFGISYLLKDSVEVEDAAADVMESLEFLLEEFAEQYKQDNEE